MQPIHIDICPVWLFLVTVEKEKKNIYIYYWLVWLDIKPLMSTTWDIT